VILVPSRSCEKIVVEANLGEWADRHREKSGDKHGIFFSQCWHVTNHTLEDQKSAQVPLMLIFIWYHTITIPPLSLFSLFPGREIFKSGAKGIRLNMEHG
jgi:hypothetical protein